MSTQLVKYIFWSDLSCLKLLFEFIAVLHRGTDLRKAKDEFALTNSGDEPHVFTD